MLNISTNKCDKSARNTTMSSVFKHDTSFIFFFPPDFNPSQVVLESDLYTLAVYTYLSVCRGLNWTKKKTTQLCPTQPCQSFTHSLWGLSPTKHLRQSHRKKPWNGGLKGCLKGCFGSTVKYSWLRNQTGEIICNHDGVLNTVSLSEGHGYGTWAQSSFAPRAALMGLHASGCLLLLHKLKFNSGM